jgi:uncharacterized protein YndB with AHSA1/START domain
MTQALKTFTVSLKRVITGSPAKVFEAWMDPKQRCNPWSYGKAVAFEPKAGKLFCIIMGGAGAHFGRILKLARGRQLQHTWMSQSTRGLESTVTISFKKHAAGTLVTLSHAGLPNDEGGRGHEAGWGYFLGSLQKHFEGRGRS